MHSVCATLDDMLSCHSFYHIFNPSVSTSYTSAQCIVASFLFECLLVCDGSLKLPVCFLNIDISDFIIHLSIL